MIGIAIRKHLQQNALISTEIGNRIYPLVAPEGEQGSTIVYQRISTSRQLTHTGGPVNLVQARIQIDAYTTGYDINRQIAAAIKQSLDGQAFTESGIVVQLCKLDNELEDFESATLEYRTTLDFIVTYEE